METLVILAAGMGKRFGSLKQLEPVGPNGELLIHYSVHDAAKAGFKKVIFVIREEMFNDFKTIVGNKIKGISVDYVFQENELIGDLISEERIKPLGTGYAVYCCKDKINGTFGVINSDDYYGYEAFKKLYEALEKGIDDFYLIGYVLENTLSKNGSVKRGICDVDNSELINITESKVEIINNKPVAIALNDEKRIDVKSDSIVSMGMYGFNSKIFDFIEKDITKYFKVHNDMNSEYFLPDVVKKMTEKEIVKTYVLRTDSKWFGMTYKEDLEEVKEKIRDMIKEGKYPENLF